ncbi:unnamed protein product [Toxocara canis]|uniref:Reverse transcriptase domain-containing protein n=1 Tax=Toxocara canis TaxID=6265 RepID=A0A183UXD8_TOXCA|nr:unnamed protein product [Toxocara canis]
MRRRRTICRELAMEDGRTPQEPTQTIASYIPHQLVITSQKETTKLRVVFDASAIDSNEDSPCGKLLRGPVLFQNLGGILVQLRCSPCVIMPDVKKAFLQVGLNERDRDMTRFLWAKDAFIHRMKKKSLLPRSVWINLGSVSSRSHARGTITNGRARNRTKDAEESLRGQCSLRCRDEVF